MVQRFSIYLAHKIPSGSGGLLVKEVDLDLEGLRCKAPSLHTAPRVIKTEVTFGGELCHNDVEFTFLSFFYQIPTNTVAVYMCLQW